jgi:hypothetical protein
MEDRNRTRAEKEGEQKTPGGKEVMLLRAVAVWFLVLIVAVVNGFVREKLFIPSLGELTGHIASTLILSALVLIVSVLLSGWIGFVAVSDALLVGAMWVAMTLAFEFLAGHYLFGTPWEKLLADYDILHGRIWSLVLLTELVSPLIARALKKSI